ncbi:MAG: bile acid:sodium symporter family protein [Nitrospinae bacterium]|nr:bile acid:sodium symporter family protein [Nitrospinota bacterium]
MRTLILLFPLWALLLSATAFAVPGLFVPWKGAIVPLLGLVMFGMGMTLSVADFAQAVARPRIVAVGVALQYLVMPLAAFVVATAFAFPPELTAGMILVGTAPGGTASNVITWLAKGDVALSITLTTVSTLLAVVLTPALTWLYLGQSVEVPFWGMMIDVAKVVLLPVAAGVALNRVGGRRLAPLAELFPAVSVGGIVLIIAIIVALNRERLADMGMTVAVAVALHNLIGMAAGYGAARRLGYPEAVCRTLAIEVGMQNSGLAVALAVKHFTPMAALPGAVFSVWHNLSGSAMASWWRRG